MGLGESPPCRTAEAPTCLPQGDGCRCGSSTSTAVSMPVAAGCSCSRLLVGSSQTWSPGTVSRSHPWMPAHDMHMATEGHTRSWWTCCYWRGRQPGAPVSQTQPCELAGCAAASLSSPLGTQEAPSSGLLRPRGPPRTPGCSWARRHHRLAPEETGPRPPKVLVSCLLSAARWVACKGN